MRLGRGALIGGTAAYLTMEAAGADFRGTRDLDIVLHLEALTPAFARGPFDALNAVATARLRDAWELRTTGRVIVAEIALAGLAGGRLAPERAGAVGRFPEVDRDLAIVVPEPLKLATTEPAAEAVL